LVTPFPTGPRFTVERAGLKVSLILKKRPERDAAIGMLNQ